MVDGVEVGGGEVARQGGHRLAPHQALVLPYKYIYYAISQLDSLDYKNASTAQFPFFKYLFCLRSRFPSLP